MERSERSAAYQISYASPDCHHGPLHATSPGAVAAFHDPAIPKSAIAMDASTKLSTTQLDEQVKQLEKWKRENDERKRLELLYKPRRNVQFAETALLYSSERDYDSIPEQWYSREELNTFKQQRKEIVQTLKRFNFDLIAVERRYCLRGYEPYFSMEVNKAMKYARSLVQSLVFTEQERQWKHNIRDVEAIRESSCCASQWARDNALQLGKNDEIEVFGDYAAMLEEAEAKASAREQQKVERIPIQPEEESLYYQDEADYYHSSSSPSQPSSHHPYERKRKGSIGRQHQQQLSSRPRTPERSNEAASVDDELESARRLYQQLRLPPR